MTDNTDRTDGLIAPNKLREVIAAADHTEVLAAEMGGARRMWGLRVMPILKVWESHSGPLPTVEGCVDGITYNGSDDLGRTIITAQCSTCHRTYTDLMILALRAVSFAKQGESSGAEPFRRCSECRKNGREPDDADKLRHFQRYRDAGRYTLRNADRWQEVEQASLRAEGQYRGRLEVKLRNMLLACDAESEKKAEETWNVD